MDHPSTERGPLSPRSGFTLIELVTVVTIVIILAGVVVPRVSGFSDKAKYAKAANDMKSIKRALEYLYQDVGYFPADAGNGIDPGLNDASRVPAARRGDWRGPYIEAWPEVNPWGGAYRYRHRTVSYFDFDGVGGNEVEVVIRDNLSTDIHLAIDEIIDDGSLSTGMARTENGFYRLYVGEGRSW
ncbi:MAG: type II secretion system protein GspG [Planctomycetota bacterium]